MKAKDMAERIVKKGLTRDDIAAEVANIDDEALIELDAVLVFTIRKMMFGFYRQGKEEAKAECRDFMGLQHNFGGHNLLEFVVLELRNGSVQQMWNLAEKAEAILFPLVAEETKKIVRGENLTDPWDISERVKEVGYYLANKNPSDTPDPNYAAGLQSLLFNVECDLEFSK